MEKYIRLLNPKTTNFDAIGGGNHGAMTAQDVCVALSYAKLTTVQSHLMELCAMNRNSTDQVKLSAQVIHAELIQTKQAEMSIEHELSIFVALVELAKVPANYTPSERNRAVIAGVSRMQIQRKMGNMINNFKELLKNEIEIASEKINYQLKKST
ncbi:hypothetical protein [Acinetobacter tandoii]|uniref:Uncharacterized protein n=1 Tax=Acinetobacter tandoii DSM 14970 = CIP 107469 TaxID=1120927 RepID=R9B766_9GAMM|nr:hypothetical protein [Acinetobacter tandoii]EOR08231.1 hypothetical protein I593_01586 [Acinetobacter tandoii DSM 14970 = CIP 107469]